jgi:hypothetical protein
MAAAALSRAGFRCTAAVLVEQLYAHEIASEVERVRQAPILPFFHPLRRERGQPPTASYADWLGDHGFFAAERVLAQLLAWKEIFDEERPDLVIGDQSPLALLAARSAGIACAAIGTGFTVPPADLERYPPWLPDRGEPLWSEQQMTDAVNAALAGVSGIRLRHLPQVYECDAAFACTPKLFDPYAEARSIPALPPNVPPLAPVDHPGDELFIYLSWQESYNPVLLAAITTLRVPRRMFAPLIHPDIVTIMRERGVRIEDEPIPPAEIAACSRMVLHSGNHGISSLCLRAGLPFVAVPQQIEQLINGLRAQQAGVGRCIEAKEMTVPHLQRTLLDLYESSAARQASVNMAHRVAQECVGTPGDIIAAQATALFH